MADLVAVRNFAEVEPGIYRGAQPLEWWEFDWLVKERGVRRFIDLRAESKFDSKMIGELMARHDDKDLRFTQYPVVDNQAPTVLQAERFLEEVRENQRDDVGTFFHCSHGRGRTSTFAAILTIDHHATAKQAMQLEADLYGYTFRNQPQIDFLNHFALVHKGRQSWKN